MISSKMYPKWILLASYLAVVHIMSISSAQETSDLAAKRQVPVQMTPGLSSNIGGLGGLLGNMLPAILPLLILFGMGALLLPLLGMLFMGDGLGGGLLDGFGKKRSLNLTESYFPSPEKMIDLLQTVTKAIEKVSKET